MSFVSSFGNEPLKSQLLKKKNASPEPTPLPKCRQIDYAEFQTFAVKKKKSMAIYRVYTLFCFILYTF